MSETKKRKVHLPEFKAKVGLEAWRGVKTINEIVQEYGVHPVQVSPWKKEIQEQAKSLFEGKRGLQPWIDSQAIATIALSRQCVLKPQTGTAADAHAGPGWHGTRPQHQPRSPAAQGVPISVARCPD